MSRDRVSPELDGDQADRRDGNLPFGKSLDRAVVDAGPSAEWACEIPILGRTEMAVSALMKVAVTGAGRGPSTPNPRSDASVSLDNLSRSELDTWIYFKDEGALA